MDVFIAITPKGDETYHDEDCVTWCGIPSLQELLTRLNGEPLFGLLIQVDVRLPRRQINTYAASNGRVSGSYDGQTLRVCYGNIDCDWDDVDRTTYHSLVEMVYKAVVGLYLRVIHGQAKGEFDIAPAETD